MPPYNDEKIIAGQGTVGLEILEDLPNVETIIVPVGGGGLISGVSAAIKLTESKDQSDRRRARLGRRRSSQFARRANRFVPGRESFRNPGRWAAHAEHRRHQFRTHPRLRGRHRHV